MEVRYLKPEEMAREVFMLRMEKKLTQEQVGEMIGISGVQVGRAEMGNSPNTAARIIAKLTEQKVTQVYQIGETNGKAQNERG